MLRRGLEQGSTAHRRRKSASRLQCASPRLAQWLFHSTGGLNPSFPCQASDITTVDSARRHEGVLSITMEGKGEVKSVGPPNSSTKHTHTTLEALTVLLWALPARRITECSLEDIEFLMRALATAHVCDGERESLTHTPGLALQCLITPLDHSRRGFPRDTTKRCPECVRFASRSPGRLRGLDGGRFDVPPSASRAGVGHTSPRCNGVPSRLVQGGRPPLCGVRAFSAA